MLSRLKIDVDKYITVYSNLAAAIFSEKLYYLSVNIKGGVNPRFNLVKLESII